MVDNTPTTLHCPSCGAPLDFDGSSSIVRCRFCKNVALIPGLPAVQEATPRASLAEVLSLAQNGDLAAATRRYRELYGVGLKEAAAAVDALAAGKVIEVHRVFSGPLNAEETNRTLDEVKALLQSGNKVGAIRHYREVNDVNLTQAKELVDQLEATLAGLPIPSQPQILGQSSTTPAHANPGKWIAVIITLSLITLVGGLLAFSLFSQGFGIGPRLYPSGVVVLASSGTTKGPMDVVSLFYNPDADTRLIGFLEGSTGKLRWQAEPLAGDGFAEAITTDDNQVYVANGTALLAYRKSDGSLAWQALMPDKLNYGRANLLIADGRVLTLNADQSLQAYDPATGSLVWSRRLAGYDRTLRLMGDSLVAIDYLDASYTYSLVFLDPADGSEQRILTPSCQVDQYSSVTLDPDSGLLYVEAENALYLVYDSPYGCVQRLDFSLGQMTWQAVPEEGFNFPSDGFTSLMSDASFYFSSGDQLLVVDKSTATLQALLVNEDYAFIPLAVTGDTLVVRARRTRGTERFELWGVNLTTGAPLWQLDLQGAGPVDPPDEMSGLIDETNSGWTWRLTPVGLILVTFQANPNQLILATINPSDGSRANERTIPLKNVTGDFYSIPTIIGWQGDLLYLSVDSNILALDVATGELRLNY
jgi:outer membrane protein assembly factor BamB/ribosomal protein L7/L12